MYKFKKLDLADEFMLCYESIDKKNKQLKFKRDIKIAQRVQSIDSEAFMLALRNLSEQGYTVDNNPYIVTRKDGNKTIIDESNWNIIIEKMKEQATVLILDEIFKKCFNMTMIELLGDLGMNLETADEDEMEKIEKFQLEFITILVQGRIQGEDLSPSNAIKK